MNMNYIEVEGWQLDDKPLVSNARVYNLGNSIRGAKYPLALDTTKMTDEIITRTYVLGNAPRGSAVSYTLLTLPTIPSV